MKWRGRKGSDNVRDTRSGRGKKMAAGGGLIAIIVAVVAMLMGGDPSALLAQFQGAGGQEQAGAKGPVDPREEELKQFSSVVLKDTEDIWNQLFQESGLDYKEPIMEVFNGNVRTACGNQSEATGPFYCPADSTVYLELGFFNLLAEQLGAKGDFARAYVIAHEVGHHIQNLTGYSAEVHKRQKKYGMGSAKANAESVRLELQADFLAGVYAHHAERRGILEPGDVEEALNAASRIGDDVLQKRSTGRVGPSESFTHGTGEQRVRWFRLGYRTGDAARMKELFDVDERDL